MPRNKKKARIRTIS